MLATSSTSGRRLSALRLAIFHGLNACEWLRPAYFAVARQYLESLVGNELALPRMLLAARLEHEEGGNPASCYSKPECLGNPERAAQING